MRLSTLISLWLREIFRATFRDVHSRYAAYMFARIEDGENSREFLRLGYIELWQVKSQERALKDICLICREIRISEDRVQRCLRMMEKK